jgi:hypothetical protein
VLPGVTVTVTSPNLIKGQETAVTNESGQWRIPALPPGVYSVSAELPGFTTAARENINLVSGAQLGIVWQDAVQLGLILPQQEYAERVEGRIRSLEKVFSKAQNYSKKQRSRRRILCRLAPIMPKGGKRSRRAGKQQLLSDIQTVCWR